VINLVGAAIRHEMPFGVVFDAWYLAEDLVRVLARRRKAWISLLKKKRLLEFASFHLRDANVWALKLPVLHIDVEELVSLDPGAGLSARVNLGKDTYWCFTLALYIPGLGKVWIVVRFEHEALTGRSVMLVTIRVDWSAARIISLYLQRWPTETFYKDSKGPLGFNEYRVRSAEAVGKHWRLVFVCSLPDEVIRAVHTGLLYLRIASAPWCSICPRDASAKRRCALPSPAADSTSTSTHVDEPRAGGAGERG
jgi:hypothetical protein